MDREIEEKAKALGEALAKSEEFARLLAAQREVESREAAKVMLRDLRRRQMALAEKEQAGETPSEEEVEALRRAMEIASHNPYVRGLIEAELVFAQLMMRVNQIVAEAAGLKPDEQEAAGGEDGSERRQTIIRPQTKLWTPGSP